ncbi:MAG TPA: nuclear transport factor 2 family protein [Gemmatimonadaceae bacterium]|nr:nuclear transport factor 2 family protein [Gemmatimonadaceae bacterium]
MRGALSVAGGVWCEQFGLMLERSLRSALLVGIVAATGSHLSAQASAPDSAFFFQTTRALLNAVTRGDSAVWSRQLSAKWFLIDEEGNRISRDEFLRLLRPLPAGQTGQLEVGRHHLVVTATTAVFSYDVNEEHDYYGHPLRTRFHTTDTWVRESAGWKQLASQVTPLPRPVGGRILPAERLRPLAGEYELTPAVRMEVAATDSGLVIRRPDRPPERLHALEERIFVRHGARGFWVFAPDSAGRAPRVTNWRDNNPLVWKRLP